MANVLICWSVDRYVSKHAIYVWRNGGSIFLLFNLRKVLHVWGSHLKYGNQLVIYIVVTNLITFQAKPKEKRAPRAIMQRKPNCYETRPVQQYVSNCRINVCSLSPDPLSSVPRPLTPTMDRILASVEIAPVPESRPTMSNIQRLFYKVTLCQYLSLFRPTLINLSFLYW